MTGWEVIGVVLLCLTWGLGRREAVRRKRAAASVAAAARELGLQAGGDVLLAGHCRGFQVRLAAANARLRPELIVESVPGSGAGIPQALEIRAVSVIERLSGHAHVETGDEAFDNAIDVQGDRAPTLAVLDAETRALLDRAVAGDLRVKEGKVVGIAFQGMRATDRINYFIPINLVKSLFPVLLGKQQIPSWRYKVQYMFPELKAYFNQGPDDGGVLLDYIIPDGGPYRFGLRVGDILLAIDDHEIDNHGDIFFRPLQQRIFAGEILNRKKVGDPLKLSVIRNGKRIEITGKVTRGLPKLVPRAFRRANYFIFGGIGFVELTFNCITNLGKSGRTFQAKYLAEFPKKPFQKIVIVSEVFPEYGLVKTSPYLKRVEKINGDDVLNITWLFDKIQELKSKGAKKAMLIITGDVRLPLDFERAEKLDAMIKAKYGILYMRTPSGFKE